MGALGEFAGTKKSGFERVSVMMQFPEQMTSPDRSDLLLKYHTFNIRFGIRSPGARPSHQVAQEKKQVRRTFRQPAHEIGIPLCTEGDIEAQTIPLLDQGTL